MRLNSVAGSRCFTKKVGMDMFQFCITQFEIFMNSVLWGKSKGFDFKLSKLVNVRGIKWCSGGATKSLKSHG